MSEKNDILDILQHVRHDWLNKIQLIKGYIALGKIDKAERVINEIILDTQQETRITNLKLPEFTYIIMTHNWGGSKFQVEYEISEHVHTKAKDETLLVKWMCALFIQLDDIANPLYENRLSITVNPRDNQNQFLFHFTGRMDNQTAIKQWISSAESSYNNIHLLKMNESELIIEFIL